MGLSAISFEPNCNLNLVARSPQLEAHSPLYALLRIDLPYSRLPRGRLFAQRHPRSRRIHVEVVRAQRLHAGDVRVKHPCSRLRSRARAIPDRAVARDLDLRLVRHLRRRVEGELTALRVVADRRAALAVVTEPDVA